MLHASVERKVTGKGLSIEHTTRQGWLNCTQKKGKSSKWGLMAFELAIYLPIQRAYNIMHGNAWRVHFYGEPEQGEVLFEEHPTTSSNLINVLYYQPRIVITKANIG